MNIAEIYDSFSLGIDNNDEDPKGKMEKHLDQIYENFKNGLNAPSFILQFENKNTGTGKKKVPAATSAQYSQNLRAPGRKTTTFKIPDLNLDLDYQRILDMEPDLNTPCEELDNNRADRTLKDLDNQRALEMEIKAFQIAAHDQAKCLDDLRASEIETFKRATHDQAENLDNHMALDNEQGMLTMPVRRLPQNFNLCGATQAFKMAAALNLDNQYHRGPIMEQGAFNTAAHNPTKMFDNFRALEIEPCKMTAYYDRAKTLDSQTNEKGPFKMATDLNKPAEKLDNLKALDMGSGPFEMTAYNPVGEMGLGTFKIADGQIKKLDNQKDQRMLTIPTLRVLQNCDNCPGATNTFKMTTAVNLDNHIDPPRLEQGAFNITADMSKRKSTPLRKRPEKCAVANRPVSLSDINTNPLDEEFRLTILNRRSKDIHSSTRDFNGCFATSLSTVEQCPQSISKCVEKESLDRKLEGEMHKRRDQASHVKPVEGPVELCSHFESVASKENTASASSQI